MTMFKYFQSLQPVFLYDRALEGYKELLPKELLSSSIVEKGSGDFQTYLKILSQYTKALRSMQGCAPHSIELVQEKKLRQVLSIANTTAWWRSYFDDHDIDTNS